MVLLSCSGTGGGILVKLANHLTRHNWLSLSSEGVDRKLGIQLCAICATDTETVAFVFVPKDDVDAQYHLMGYGLKCACPVERYSTSAVRNRLKWLILCLRNRQPEHRVQHLFE